MMNSVLSQFFEAMTLILSRQEKLYGQLKLLSSRTEKTSHSIDKIITAIIEKVKILESSLRFKLYNIKIFTEDSCKLEIKESIPIMAICYNYFLLNTNFSSQHLLRKDTRFGIVVGLWPTLSLYLFIQIIWHLKCEDLLVESLVHIPLDLCVQILETTIKHINELQFPRARRLVFLLIYKVYYKCLWLHLGTLSEQNMMERVHQLITYFDKLLDFLVNPVFVTSRASCINEKYLQHGILVKNMLHYIRKCMHSKIENFWKNCNLAALFTLTYGNFNEHTNYNHMLLVDEVKSIITKLDQKLTNLLVNEIKHIEPSEYIVWKSTVDDETTIISLQQGIVMECHYFIEFVKQNEFFVTNEELFLYLERLVDPKKPEESVLTLQELCRKIADGRLHGMREVIKRYKEWDLSILDFINGKIKLLKIYDVFVILEYLHYKFAYLHTNAEKYRVYVSVLRILLQLTVNDLHSVVQNYVEQHFDDNPLENLYSERCFTEFIEKSSFMNSCETLEILVRTQETRTLLIFILLNPKDVLSKFVMYEIGVEFSNDFMFEEYMCLVRSYYTLRSSQYNVLMYILKDMLFVQRVKLCSRFIDFMDNLLEYKMITADDLINELYVSYLVRNCLERTNIVNILLHIYSVVKRRLFTNKTDIIRLTIILLKMISLLRRGSKTFSKVIAYDRGDIINSILWDLHELNALPDVWCYLMYSYIIEPLEMKSLFPTFMDTFKIIQEYEKRCFVIHQRLRTDPRCHFKLRNYVQSFKLDRKAFIRHMMLHCFKIENEIYGVSLALKFFHHFGWANEMIAYENIMHISAEALQITLMYIESFSKNTFIMLLDSIVGFSGRIESVMSDNQEEVRRILLKTLSSVKNVVGETRYKLMYVFLLKHIYDGNLSYLTGRYYETCEWICALIHGHVPCTVSLINCTCDKCSYCKRQSVFRNRIATMYNAYLFICECIKIPTMYHRYYHEQLLHNLCPE